MLRLTVFGTFFLLFIAIGCHSDKVQEVFETENVIIIVIDGPRYSESWGDPTHANIPCLDSLKSLGVFFPNFFNDGVTRTLPGHTAMLTGVYEDLDNTGLELPTNPSIFQCWAKEFGAASNDAWIITSKDKLEVLGNCTRNGWENEFIPPTHCGVNGAALSSGYQEDSATVAQGLEILQQHHPKLVLFNLREPDYSGHEGNWNQYLAGLQRSDEYVKQIVDFVQNDFPAFNRHRTDAVPALRYHHH